MEQCGECEEQSLPECILSECILSEFEKHTDALRIASRARKESMTLRNVVVDGDVKQVISEADTLGKLQPSDVYNGDVNLRTLRTLLKMVDQAGWER